MTAGGVGAFGVVGGEGGCSGGANVVAVVHAAAPAVAVAAVTVVFVFESGDGVGGAVGRVDDLTLSAVVSAENGLERSWVDVWWCAQKCARVW